MENKTLKLSANHINILKDVISGEEECVNNDGYDQASMYELEKFGLISMRASSSLGAYTDKVIRFFKITEKGIAAYNTRTENKTPEQKFDEHWEKLKTSEQMNIYYEEYREGWLACHAEMEENYRQKSIEFNFKILVENEELETKIKDLESQLAAKEETINNLQESLDFSNGKLRNFC